MASAEETIGAIQKTLAPYVKPREEAAHIRRVLALHLRSGLKDVSEAKPLALAEPSKVDLSPETRGLQREYLKALIAHGKARKEFDAALRDQESPREASPLVSDSKPDWLEEHLASIRLQKKQQKLQAVLKYLDSLAEKPAASPDFLDPNEIFKGLPLLPGVPQEVVNGLSRDLTASKTDLGDLVSQLEKQVLRAKLLLKREERLLEEMKAQSSIRPEHTTDQARSDALNSARNELIAWIESELGKAGDGEEEPEHGAGADTQPGMPPDPGHLDEQLADIKSKYASYLAARKALVQLVSQPPQPIIKPKPEEPTQETASASEPVPVAHLLSPYLQRLLEVGHEQKGLIAQKSHLSIAIAKQLKENYQILDHVAEESQLLPRYPVRGTTRRKLGFGDSLATPETLDLSSRVTPWVAAADSAKISTLEIVAEKIEGGQHALEGAVQTLAEIEKLLGRAASSRDVVANAGGAEDDIWLAESSAAARSAKARKPAGKSSSPQTGGHVWDILDGSLGLIRSEDGSP